jgi:hypothetical protein
MKDFFASLVAWYQRRFRGVVHPPRRYGGQGTTWFQHKPGSMAFFCQCGEHHRFTERNYVVRERIHHESCIDHDKCRCPIKYARYVWKCPHCGRGHWMDASGQAHPEMEDREP